MARARFLVIKPVPPLILSEEQLEACEQRSSPIGWSLSLMSGPEISAFFYDLPLIVKCVIVPSALLVACSILRLVSNCLPSQRPPVFEGVPFIGGVLKFVQVMQFLEIDKMCTKRAYTEREYARQPIWNRHQSLEVLSQSVDASGS